MTPTASPASPAWTLRGELVRPADGVGALAVDGAHAYLARGPELTVVAVSGDGAPRVVARHATAAAAWRLAVAGGRAYITLPDALEIVDVGDPAAPRRLAVVPIGPHLDDVQVIGPDQVVISDGEALQVWQLPRLSQRSQPGDAPRAIGRIAIELARRVTVAGTRAYVASELDGLVIVDLADPARPRRLGGFEGPGELTKVAVVGDVAYLADYSGGLLRLDVRDPRRPRKQLAWDEGMVGDVAATAEHVFVAMGDLVVLDATAAQARVVARCVTRPGDTAWNVAYQDGRVYALGEAGLSIWAAG